MNPLDRFVVLLLHPQAATEELYEHASVETAFVFVSVYAVASGLHATLTVVLFTDIPRFYISSFLITAAAAYVQWIVLACVLRAGAALFGGAGTLVKALGYTGFAAAPLVVTTGLSILGLFVLPLFAEGDPIETVTAANALLSIAGMVWGLPGFLCYYGVQNGELLESYKAAIIVAAAFCLTLAFMALTSGDGVLVE